MENPARGPQVKFERRADSGRFGGVLDGTYEVGKVDGRRRPRGGPAKVRRKARGRRSCHVVRNTEEAEAPRRLTGFAPVQSGFRPMALITVLEMVLLPMFRPAIPLFSLPAAGFDGPGAHQGRRRCAQTGQGHKRKQKSYAGDHSKHGAMICPMAPLLSRDSERSRNRPQVPPL